MMSFRYRLFVCIFAIWFSSKVECQETECVNLINDTTLLGLLPIVGGEPAGKGEFPHMALLGFGDQLKNVTWQCGGTLISAKWVMTAGFCLINYDIKDVKYVWLGVPGVEDPIDNKNVYTVIQAVPHPDYSRRSVYNNIALLELDRAVDVKPHIHPACLHTGDSAIDDTLLASGWGVTSCGGGKSIVILKVTLEKYSYEVCRNIYVPQKRFKDGLRDATQLCAGHRTENKDSCQGGAPLQIHKREGSCPYTVVGIVSTGRGCGGIDRPSIYTRVSAFVPWIKSVVWP